MNTQNNSAELDTLVQSVRPPAHQAYRRDVDGLRAIAVLSVVLYHAFPSVLRGGFIGVDIFFVISGFLISSIILKELEQGNFSFARFYARRVKRIFPALILVIGASLAFAWFALFPDEYQQLGKHVVGGAGFAANFFYWAQIGYFDTAAETKPLLHLWSLGIEEQFYIVWPAVLLLASKRRANLLAVIACVAWLSFLLNVGGINEHASATFYSPASRAWELLLGAGLASLSLRADGPTLAQAQFAPDWRAAAGVALLTLGLTLITRQQPFPGSVALLPTAGALLIIGAGPQAWFNRVVLSHPVLVWFGLISYPLYLWHWPLLTFAQIVESRLPSPAMRAGALVLAVMLAWLTWRMVERPLRFRPGRATVAALCALMAATATAGGYLYLREGLPTRAPIKEHQANLKALILVEDRANAAACKQRYGFTHSIYEYCLLSKIDKDPTVVLIGDSHAYNVVAGLTRYYNSLGDNLLLLGTRVPYWGLPARDDPYQQVTQPMLERALNMATVKTAIFSTHYRFDRTPEGIAHINAARETFRRFLAAGKQVIFMDDIPTLPFDPRSCIKRAGLASSATTSPCAITRKEWDTQIAEHDAILKDLAREFPQIEWFQSSTALCDASYCNAMINGRLMYRDTNHLSYEGDLLVGKQFAEWQRNLRSKRPDNAHTAVQPSTQ